MAWVGVRIYTEYLIFFFFFLLKSLFCDLEVLFDREFLRDADISDIVAYTVLS